MDLKAELVILKLFFLNTCEITNFKLVLSHLVTLIFHLISLEQFVFLCVVWRQWRTEAQTAGIATIETNFKISAVCVHVWAEKQRDAPGLSNELTKKCSWSMPMTISW